MIYRVEWTPPAAIALVRLWTEATDRDRFVAAVRAIAARLKRDPYARSESRSGRERILFKGALAVRYHVFKRRRLVTITAVWRPTRRA
jgi:hypothetical protein